MAMAKSAVTAFTIMALFGAAMAAVYNVGESAGWTTIGNVDYRKWADEKNFRVGDTLVFKYNPSMHDVKQVSQADFAACNGKSPIASYNSGSDSITLKEPGKAYFLCGFAGHCQVGQKLEIQVNTNAQSPGDSPAPSPSKSATSASKSATASSPTGSATASTPTTSISTGVSSSSTPPTSPDSPPPSSASSLYSSGACLVSAVLAVSAAFAF